MQTGALRGKLKNYTIYFEIYGKKMKTTVMAESEEKAKELVKSKINFHKIEKSKDVVDDILNFLGGKRP